MNSYRHCRIRRHILFTQARLAARTRHARTQHPVLVRALVLSWLITAALAFAALIPSDRPHHPPTAPTPAATAAPVPTTADAPAPAPAPARDTTHTVRAGQTLAAIAVRYRVPMRRIADDNHLPDPDRITVGQRLRITAAPPDTVVISPGVTLTGIARAHHLSVNALMVLNPALTDPDRILAGAGLRLPVAATAGRYPDRVRAGGAGQGRR